MTLSAREYTQQIKQWAQELGFMSCGVSKADFLEEEAPHLESWLNQNRHGEMAYMANHFDKRLDPRLLVPGAKSVVSLLFNYFPSEEREVSSPKISKYAWGEDYHLVVKDKLFQLVERIREEIGEVEGRAFVDSAPVLEKAWAAKSGLGWIGKNGNLLSKKTGSFFFIAELIIDLELEADGPTTDHCGSCTACIDACPTQAIVADKVVDGSRCISYFTIELKKEVPQEWKSQLDDWAFGCDVCQDVCPWNRFSLPHNEPRFTLNSVIKDADKGAWKEMTEEVFKKHFGNSPLARAGIQRIQSNITD